MKIFFKILPILLFSPIVSFSETIYSLQDAILIALKNNPTILASATQKDIYKNKALQMESTLSPQINLSGGYSRTSPIPSVTTKKDTNDQYDLYSIGLDLKINLYDFNKTKYMSESFKYMEKSSEYDLLSLKSNIISQIIVNFYKLLQAQENLSVAIQTRDNLKKHLEMAQAFYKTGIKPKYDITKAEVNLSNAELNIIKAQNIVKLIESEIKKLLGIDNINFNTKPEIAAIDNPSDLKLLIEKGLKQRNELFSIKEKIKSSELTLKATKANILPTLNLESSYQRSGPHPNIEKDGWNIGVKFNIPIYNGNLTNYQINETLANIENLKQLEQSVILSIKNEIETAYYNIIEAQKKYSISSIILKQAKENYEIALGRYNAGLSNPIELSDAEVELEKGKLNLISSKYDYLISKALLKKAVGDTYE